MAESDRTQPDSTQVTIGSQEGRQAFEIRVNGEDNVAGFTQFVDMPDTEPAERIFPHTLVKDEYAGQGLASILVREALDQTIADGKRIIAVCPYVKGWVEKHPEYAEHVNKTTKAHLDALQD